MLSWILIPIYLLRNTLHRWWENLASPLTKVVVPLLLSALGLLVLGFLRAAESNVKEQLQREDLRTIRLTESFYGKKIRNVELQLEDDKALWSEYCETYQAIQKLPVVVKTRWSKQTPVFAYDEEPTFLDLPEAEPGEPRELILFVDDPERSARAVITYERLNLNVRTQAMDEGLREFLSGNSFLLMPLELAESAMEAGFTQLQILVPDEKVDPIELERRIRSYASLEERQINISSATKFLKRLQLLLDGQQTARWILAGAIMLILSLILGSLSLLEFRQEIFILALLRSFGVGAWTLGVHFFLETLALTALGAGLGMLLVQELFPILSERLAASGDVMDLTLPALELVQEDLFVLGGAALAGVCLSMLPVIWGLRKKPGLILT